MTTIPLILAAYPVSRFDPAARRSRRPSVAVVYATGDGHLDVIDGGRPIRLKDQRTRSYRYRYDVDMSDHHRTVELRTSPPPARGGVHHFTALVTIGFRVIDPAQVVRRNIRDALRVVCDHLMFGFREITVNFPIDAAKQAEDAINDRFRGSTTIDGVVELFRCQARLSPDPEATRYLRAEQHARAQNRVRTAEHELEADDADREVRIELIRQRGSLEQRRREREALGGRPIDMQDLLTLHIERHPDDTLKALEAAERLRDKEREHADHLDQRRWEKLQFMADRQLMQPVDVHDIRNEVLDGLSRPVASLSTGAAADSWDDPVPDDKPSDALPGLIPVYLVLEESSAVALGIKALNHGLREICDGLASHPEIARVVRLAVLTYAGEAAVRLPLREVWPAMPVPALVSRSEPVQLAAAFERLRECIPLDADLLKAQTPSLRRPQVLLLSGGRPADEEAWAATRRALVDRESQRYAPDIIACGLGTADPQTVLDIATRDELAFLAPGRDIEAASHSFCAFARRRIVAYGRAVLDGDQNATITGPEGFRPATEFITSSTQGN